jgi:hypothetical protein
MAIAHHVGYDGTNRPDPIDDLPIIGDMYKRYLAGDRKDLGPLCFTVDSSLLNSSFSAVSHAPIMETGTWPTMPLTSLCHDIFNGATPARAKYTQTGHRVLKVRDLTNEGLDWDVGERAFVESAFFSKHLRQRIQVGDILITAAAHHPSYIGKKVDIVDWIPEEYSKGVLATAEILVIRPNTQLIDPLYLLMYLRTEQGYQALQSCVTGQTAHIYPRDVGKIMIPLPPNEIKTKLRPAFEELESSLELRRKFKAAHHHSKSLFELGLPCQDRPNTIKDEGTDKIP